MEKIMIQQTIWAKADSILDSQYGRSTWGMYLAKEAERINKNPTRFAEVRQNSHFRTQKALFVNCEAVVFNVKYAMPEEFRGAMPETVHDRFHRLPEELLPL